MSTHRQILARALTRAGHTHKTIAKAMGWSTPATAGHKLSGIRPWHEGELVKMCELAGVTLAWLSANSSDLHVTKHREALRGAVLLDELSPEQRAAMISLMESMAKPPDPEKG